jgi:hypothetical protein
MDANDPSTTDMEPDHLPFSPICVAQRKMKISSRSVLVVESGGVSGELPSDIACFFVPAPELPQGIHVDPRLSKETTNGLFQIYLINDSDTKIKLQKFQVLGRITFEINPPTKQSQPAPIPIVERTISTQYCPMYQLMARPP